MEAMLLGIVQKINGYLSDYVLIVLLVSAGLYFSIRTRFVQVRCFGEGMRRVFGNIKLNGGKQHGGEYAEAAHSFGNRAGKRYKNA